MFRVFVRDNTVFFVLLTGVFTGPKSKHPTPFFLPKPGFRRKAEKHRLFGSDLVLVYLLRVDGSVTLQETGPDPNQNQEVLPGFPAVRPVRLPGLR